MLALITILILILASLTIGVLLVVNPKRSFTWVIATGGTLLAWILVMLWQLNLPDSVTLTNWQPTSLFPDSPFLSIDGISWVYGISLITLCFGVILTAPVRTTAVSPLAMTGVMLLTALGLVAVMAGNPLTLLIAWAAIDLTELVVILRSFSRPQQSESAVVAFSARLAGIAVVMWASILGAASGSMLTFQSITENVAILLLIGVGLRLGVLPLHLPYRQEPAYRRGFGTILRMVSAASSLVLLARIPQTNISGNIELILFATTAVTAIYGAWKWARSSNPLSGRPYWMIGMGALAIASDLRGNPTGSAAWGSALVLAGGSLFIASHETKWLKWLMVGTAFGISSLPFSLTSTVWVSNINAHWWHLLLFLPAQILLITGFVRFALAPRDPLKSAQPQGAQSVYPIAFVLMAFIIFLLGLWGWNGASQLGAWITGIITAILASGVLIGLSRLQTLVPTATVALPTGTITNRIGNIIQNTTWSIYRLLRQVSFILSQMLEGDGGILWALLLLVLFASLIQGVR